MLVATVYQILDNFDKMKKKIRKTQTTETIRRK